MVCRNALGTLAVIFLVAGCNGQSPAPSQNPQAQLPVESAARLTLAVVSIAADEAKPDHARVVLHDDVLARCPAIARALASDADAKRPFRPLVTALAACMKDGKPAQLIVAANPRDRAAVRDALSMSGVPRGRVSLVDGTGKQGTVHIALGAQSVANADGTVVDVERGEVVSFLMDTDL